MTDDVIIFEGNLEKESLYLKTFRKRWIVLKGDRKLYSFKSNKISEIIDLSKCKNVKILNESTWTFALIFDENKHRNFKAMNKNEMNLWIECIQKSINHDDDADDEKKNGIHISLIIFYIAAPLINYIFLL